MATELEKILAFGAETVEAALRDNAEAERNLRELLAQGNKPYIINIPSHLLNPDYEIVVQIVKYSA